MRREEFPPGPGFQNLAVNGGGRIIADPSADLLKPIVKCECLWGANECPNELAWIIVCQNVRGFTAACEPHAINFAHNVDPHDGSYTYATPDQFARMKDSGLYTTVNTYRDWFKCVVKGMTRMDYEDMQQYGIFP